MPAATITNVYPALNKAKGINKHYTVMIKGTNLDKNTTVKARLGSLNWVVHDLKEHDQGLLVWFKRREEDPDGKPEPEGPRQIEQITVTVQNGAIPIPAEGTATVPFGTFNEP